MHLVYLWLGHSSTFILILANKLNDSFRKCKHWKNLISKTNTLFEACL